MGSIYITDWKYGMDRRRKRVAGVAGTLWTGRNVQITRGGDIERPKRFVPTFNLPAGLTFGLGSVRGQVYVFGSGTAPVGLPIGVQYQQLAAPSGAAMAQVLDVRGAGGKLYVMARYADGNIFHFYDGARVTEWDALADSNTDLNSLAAYMSELVDGDPAVSAVAFGATMTITARVAGTAFAITKSTTDFGGTNDQDITLTTVQANVSALAEVRATSVVTFVAGSSGVVQDIKANGVSLMFSAVTWATDNATTLAQVAQQINNKTSTHGYSAAAAGSNLTISAPLGTGATPNNYVVSSVVTGNLVLSTPSMSGGVTAVTGVAQIVTAQFVGSAQPTDRFDITINSNIYTATGRAAGTGVSGYVYKKRLWSCAGSLWAYCKLLTYNNWSDAGAASGSSFFNLSNEAEGSERLIGSGTYITQTAVFSRRNCRIYNMDTDATKVTLAQPIDNTGALASRSILQYGTTDLFYLDETGIRSLKARDASGAAFVNDIGVAIDPFVRDHIDSLSSAVVQRACSVVEPRDGRYWLAIGNRIFVLSYFPGSGISAWTYFEPGFSVSDFARCYNKLYVRAGDTIYLYGGSDGQQYPIANEMVAYVELPFASASPPGREMLSGFDMAATGEWQINVLTDPNREAIYSTVGTLDGVSYSETDVSFPGRTTHVAFNMTCSVAGAAGLSNLTVHTIGGEPDE